MILVKDNLQLVFDPNFQRSAPQRKKKEKAFTCGDRCIERKTSTTQYKA